MSDSGRRTREVLVRTVRTAPFANARVAARALEFLDGEERGRLARLRAARASRDYLAAHALARTTLAEIVGCSPARVRIHTSPGGRPELVSPQVAPRLRFSISHADGIALCAVAAGRAIGVDIESDRNIGPDALGVAEAVCSPREMQALRALPPPERADFLLLVWSVKEAVAKAAGVGFHLSLSHITVRAGDDGDPALDFDADVPDDAHFWRVASFRVSPDHLGAVAVHLLPDEGIDVRIEEDHRFAGLLAD